MSQVNSQHPRNATMKKHPCHLIIWRRKMFSIYYRKFLKQPQKKNDVKCLEVNPIKPGLNARCTKFFCVNSFRTNWQNRRSTGISRWRFTHWITDYSELVWRLLYWKTNSKRYLKNSIECFWKNLNLVRTIMYEPNQTIQVFKVSENSKDKKNNSGQKRRRIHQKQMKNN